MEFTSVPRERLVYVKNLAEERRIGWSCRGEHLPNPTVTGIELVANRWHKRIAARFLVSLTLCEGESSVGGSM